MAERKSIKRKTSKRGSDSFKRGRIEIVGLNCADAEAMFNAIEDDFNDDFDEPDDSPTEADQDVLFGGRGYP